MCIHFESSIHFCLLSLCQHAIFYLCANERIKGRKNPTKFQPNAILKVGRTGKFYSQNFHITYLSANRREGLLDGDQISLSVASHCSRIYRRLVTPLLAYLGRRAASVKWPYSISPSSVANESAWYLSRRRSHP